MTIRFRMNGHPVEVDADPAMPVLWVIRDRLGMTGTKYGCGVAQCGACTIHINGAAARSCMLPIQAIEGADITTIEGLSEHRSHPVQKAWEACSVPQCGYCQSGMVMAVAALISQNPNPGDEDIESSITNICRCGTYERIRAAIRIAVKEAGHGKV